MNEYNVIINVDIYTQCKKGLITQSEVLSYEGIWHMAAYQRWKFNYQY